MAHWIFKEEHLMFRKAIRKFVDNEVVPFIEDWEKSGVPRSLFEELGKLGYFAISLPEEQGGTDLDFTTEAILIEELTRAGAAGVALSVQMHVWNSLHMLASLGNDHQKDQYLGPGLLGEKIGTLLISDEKNSISVTREEEGFILNGKYTAINGPFADFLIVVPNIEGDKKRVKAFIIEANEKGVTRTKSSSQRLGWRSLPTCEITFENVKVSNVNVLGDESEAYTYMTTIIEREKIFHSLQCLVLGERALQSAIQYSKERQQFGQYLSSFQSLRHKMADMAISLEKARSMTYRAVYDYEQDPSGHPFLKSATIASVYSKKMVMEVTDEALQIHGGAGYMMEFPIQRFWRDAKMYGITDRNRFSEDIKKLCLI